MKLSLGPLIRAGKRARKLLRRTTAFRWLRSVLGLSSSDGKSLINVLDELQPFIANSGGRYKARAALTLDAAQQVFSAIEAVSDPALRNVSFESATYRRIGAAGGFAESLGSAFSTFGSDKATTHDYHKLYGTLFDQPHAVEKILEIGLGTNNTTVVSNMGRKGRPGASLRAFRECFVNARLVGLEYDTGVLFQEDRIETYYVDQTKPHTFSQIDVDLGGNFDLMIDDGLHSPHANLYSLQFFLTRLKVGGYAVIEDVSSHSKEIWELVSKVLARQFESALISTRGAYVFLVQRVE